MGEGQYCSMTTLRTVFWPGEAWNWGWSGGGGEGRKGGGVILGGGNGSKSLEGKNGDEEKEENP